MDVRLLVLLLAWWGPMATSWSNPSFNFSDIDAPFGGDEHPLIEERGELTVTRGETIRWPLADPPAGVRRYRASGLPPGLSIDPDTGEISGVVKVIREHDIVIEARRDHLTDPVAFLRFRLFVNDHPFFNQVPSFELLVNGQSATVAVAKGEIAGSVAIEVLHVDPATLDVEVVSLPPGWVFDRESLEISGVVEASGIYPLAIDFRTGEQTFRLERNVHVGDRDAGVIRHQASREFAVGEDVELSYVAEGAKAPVTFFAEGLPEGLELDEATGVVSGRAQQFGRHDYLIGFEDADGVLGQTYQSYYRIVGNSWPSPPQRQSRFRDYQLPHDGPFPLEFESNEFEILSLPDGLTFTPPNMLTRDPALDEGLYQARVRLTNETGYAEVDLWLAFFTPREAERVELINEFGDPRVGIPYKGTLRGLEGATKISVANLPPGLAFNETERTVTGIPTRAGTWENRVLSMRDGVTVAFNPGEIRIEAAWSFFDGSGQSAALRGREWEWSLLSEAVLTETLPPGIERISATQLYGMFETTGRFEISLTYADGTPARAPAVVHSYAPPIWGPERRRARVLPATSLFDTARVAVLERRSPFSSAGMLRTTAQAGEGTDWSMVSYPGTGMRSLTDIVRGDDFVLAGSNWWSVSSSIKRFSEADIRHTELRSLAAEGPLVVAASGGLLSLEGAEWILLPESDPQLMHGVAIGNGRIVGVGALGKIEVFTTDKVLVDKVQPVQATLKDVLFSEGEFIAVGDEGTILRSADGVSWEVERGPTLLGADFRHVTANEDWIVAVAPWTTLGKRRAGGAWMPLERLPIDGSYIDALETEEGAAVGGFATGLYVPARANSSVTVLSSLCQAAIVGEPFDYAIGALAGNEVAYRVEGLPEGLAFDSANGRIHGEIQQKGGYEILVEASAGNGVHGKKLAIDAYHGINRLLVNEIEVGAGTEEWAVPTTYGTHVIRIEDAHEEGTRDIAVSLETGAGIHHDVITVHVVAPKPIFLTQPESVQAAEGARVLLTADIQGQWPINLQWFRNGIALDGENGLQLEIPSLTSSQVGEYTLHASNALGGNTSAGAEVRFSNADPNEDAAAVVRLFEQEDGFFLLQIELPPIWPDSTFTIQESADLEVWEIVSPLSETGQTLEDGRERLGWTLPASEKKKRFVRLLLDGGPGE